MTTLKTWHLHLTGTYIKSLFARTRERQCSIRALQWTLPWPEEIFQNGSSICRQDLEKMDSGISSAMEQDIEVVKRTCAKPERRWIFLAGIWLREALWLQARTNPWDLHWQRQCFAISENQNGTWRAEPASREVTASILWWCFRGWKQGWRCWRQFKSAAETIRQQEVTFETEKTLNLSKLKNGQKWKFLQVASENLYTPPFLERKTWGTRGHSARLGWPLSYSWTQRKLLHETHKCGY